ncbi:MAG: DNA repair protein RadC [Methylotenera sp.]|nr:DNA repair protein RadC [Methylotenera sp.]MDP1959814.1 DNA repair protein RadC [Methylotenera sp.]MDP3207455.1 DNA repair protein RadC [Methylotenera sp.]MDP3304041.1 DNA repair protein RadC [Methylotenera sp.]MDP3942650.1 DNA repair protein RadC [Methylotenera sp.]
MAITDWPAAERPREKLIALGAEALSDAELLAIFLRVGVVGKSAVDLARDLLSQFGSLNGIFAASESELSQVHGIGSSKYVQLQAIFEMSRRALNEQFLQRDIFQSPQQVRDYLVLRLGALTREVFLVMFLDAQNRLNATEELFSGTLTQTSVYPREVIKRALHHNAAGVIFAHNHPSGVAQQSSADELLTKQLKQALALVDVRVLDHFIVAGNQTLSFVERGLL